MLRFPTLACCLSVFACLLTGCAVLQESSKYDFSEGLYRTTLVGSNRDKVYMEPAGDTFQVIPYDKSQKEIDRSAAVLSYPALSPENPLRSRPQHFIKPSLDLDVLTIPFKYRPSVSGFPQQLNTNFNGALYLGYRADRYRLSYRKSPLGLFKRRVTHTGYSLGVLCGLGSTAVNPWVTGNRVESEYDGLVINTGLAFITALNNLSFGIGAGTDYLADANSRHWIYQGKPWLGVMFGLNLN